MRVTDDLILSTPAQINSLADLLARVECVAKFDRSDEAECGVLVHTFSGLEESFHAFLYDLLPKLISGKLSESEIEDLLLQIGEEFRHILYHISDPQFYRYLEGGIR